MIYNGSDYVCDHVCDHVYSAEDRAFNGLRVNSIGKKSEFYE